MSLQIVIFVVVTLAPFILTANNQYVLVTFAFCLVFLTLSFFAKLFIVFCFKTYAFLHKYMPRVSVA